jgi:CubicO group peptidase (beta-lactamase class C family)
LKTLRRRNFLKEISAGAVLGSAGLLGACALRGDGSTASLEPIASNPLDTSPGNQAATFRNFDRLAPTRLIGRGASVLPLPEHRINLAPIRYTHGEQRYSIDDYMRRNRTSGILILKGGAITLERYAMGNTSKSRWTSFSVAKSITSTLIGAALKDGSIASLEDGIAKYVRELRDSAFAENSIQDLLNMTSGVRWEEDYSIFHRSDIVRFELAIASQRGGAVMDLLKTRKRAHAPGSVFNYSTADSYVLGAVVAAATGSALSDYLSSRIWAPLGMESDGYWLLDAPNGLETGGDNLSATLRDYGRFGLFFLNGGVIDGVEVLPAGWRELATKPHTPVAAYGHVDDDPLGYGYQWWAFPTGAAALPFHDGAFTAQGIFGQFLYINPREDLVAVVWDAWRSPWEDSAEIETYAMIGAAAAALHA